MMGNISAQDLVVSAIDKTKLEYDQAVPGSVDITESEATRDGNGQVYEIEVKLSTGVGLSFWIDWKDFKPIYVETLVIELPFETEEEFSFKSVIDPSKKYTTAWMLHGVIHGISKVSEDLAKACKLDDGRIDNIGHKRQVIEIVSELSRLNLRLIANSGLI